MTSRNYKRCAHVELDQTRCVHLVALTGRNFCPIHIRQAALVPAGDFELEIGLAAAVNIWKSIPDELLQPTDAQDQLTHEAGDLHARAATIVKALGEVVARLSRDCQAFIQRYLAHGIARLTRFAHKLAPSSLAGRGSVGGSSARGSASSAGDHGRGDAA